MMRLFFFSILLLLGNLRSFGQACADLILYNGNIITMKNKGDHQQAIAIKDGLILATGKNSRILSKFKCAETKVIDLNGKTVIPGLNDSHIHAIREGLNFNAELRWDGVKTLKRALEMLKEQADRTPEGYWVKVVGGWNEFQFEEGRLPTLDEINAAVPDKPVFITYLYGKAFVNRKGLELLRYDKNTRYEGSLVELDASGMPTGLLLAKQTPRAIYATLALTSVLTSEEKANSTLQFYRELNRFGLTSTVDAGGGGQHYPGDYEVIKKLADEGRLTLRTAYYLFAQQKGRELADYKNWVAVHPIQHQNNMLIANGYSAEGAGENIVASAADFENFLEPRIELSDTMESDLEPVIRLLVQNRWPFRLHATYGESIERMLAVFEKVNRDIPFNGLRWFFDHAETITDAQLLRVKKLGGGIAVQFRMYYQGELYQKQYGAPVRQLPPIKRMLSMGLPVGMGTDATRISSYNPWLALHWLITGQTIGGLQFWPKKEVLDRYTALQLYTSGSAWCSGEEKLKGRLVSGMFADMAVLSDDYFFVEAEAVKRIESVMTIVNGKIVYAQGEFASYSPPPLTAIPAWSPVNFYGGYQR